MIHHFKAWNLSILDFYKSVKLYLSTLSRFCGSRSHMGTNLQHFSSEAHIKATHFLCVRPLHSADCTGVDSHKHGQCGYTLTRPTSNEHCFYDVTTKVLVKWRLYCIHFDKCPFLNKRPFIKKVNHFGPGDTFLTHIVHCTHTFRLSQLQHWII